MRRGEPSQANRCLTTCHSQSKNADDIVITVAIRTPLTKARKGGFKDSGIEYLTYCLLKELKTRSGIDPALVEDFAFGNVRLRLMQRHILPPRQKKRKKKLPPY